MNDSDDDDNDNEHMAIINFMIDEFNKHKSYVCIYKIFKKTKQYKNKSTIAQSLKFPRYDKDVVPITLVCLISIITYCDSTLSF